MSGGVVWDCYGKKENMVGMLGCRRIPASESSLSLVEDAIQAILRNRRQEECLTR